MYTIDLTGKTGMIFGVANHRSLAWAIAEQLGQAGCRLAFSYQGERLKENVAKLAAPLPGAGRYIAAEAVHAVTHQGALDLDDILSRRTRTSIEASDRGRAAAAVIAPLVAPALGWSETRHAEEIERYRRLRDAEEAGEAAPDDAAAAAAYRAVMAG